MNDEIFAAMARQMKPDAEVRNQLLAELRPNPAAAAEPTVRRRRAGWIAVAACAAALASATLLPGAIGHGRPVELGDPPQAPPAPVTPEPSTTTPADARGAAGDYGTLFAAVREASRNWQQFERWTTADNSGLAASAAPVPVPAIPAWGAQDAGATKTDGAYQTNAQVAGIDEGDLVKSDGSSLFVASGRQVAILAADGAKTRELARIDTGSGPAADASAVKGVIGQGPVADLMLYDHTLVVLVTDYAARIGVLPASQTSTSVPLDAALTRALLYDVSDPARPRYLASLGQSGALVTSRLADGILYLVTEYLVSDPDGMKPDDPETFVPVTTSDAKRAAVPAPDCIPLPYADGPRYAVASSIDLASGERIDTEAVLGGAQTVYLSAQNLYLAATDGNATLTRAQLRAAGAGDLRVADATVTHLARIGLDVGRLTLQAQASVPGQLVNQFALDEYQDHLRLTTTVSGERRDGSGEWVTRPALYVLDRSLKTVGSLPKLAKDETVQSVRFDGPVGYVVSFRQRDPLFAIDLADPARPKVLSALKIPGFSTYLHPWADGRLFGLGMDATGDGAVTGMKLSMFDTSDPFDVTQRTTLTVAFDTSEALADHKAVLVDTDRGLIGFPVAAWNRSGGATVRYLVYGYDEKAGFSRRATLAVAGDGDAQDAVRGLRIADSLYVASGDGVAVYDTDDFAKLAAVRLG